VNLPLINLVKCVIALRIGWSALSSCFDDFDANVIKNAIRNATHAVLKTSDTRTARMDLIM